MAKEKVTSIIKDNQPIHIEQTVPDTKVMSGKDLKDDIVKRFGFAKKDEPSQFDKTIQSSKATKILNTIIAACRFIITAIVSLAIIMILVSVACTLTVATMESTLLQALILSNEAVIATAAAMGTSVVWILVLKLKLFETIFKFFHKIIPNLKG